jgi:hypothetical protein
MTMNIVLTCHDCERLIELTERPKDGKFLCPTCGTLLIVPAPGAAADEPDGVYATPGVKHCPQCKKAMAGDAVICIDCGFNFRSGRRTEKVIRVQEVERSWWYGAIPVYFFDVRLRKTRDGREIVTVTDKLLFMPLNTTEIDLRQCREIWTDYREGFGAVGLTIMLLLCLFCLIPGGIWWWWAFNKPNSIVRLPYKKSYVTLYDGWSDTKKNDILDTISAMGGLTIVRK